MVENMEILLADFAAQITALTVQVQDKVDKFKMLEDENTAI